MEESKPIGGGLAFTLILFGVLIDLIQALLTFLLIGAFVNPAFDFFAILGFGIMLYHHGGKVLSRRATSFTLTAIAEFIPIISALLPIWTGFAIYTVVMDRVKHALHNEPDAQPRGGSWRL